LDFVFSWENGIGCGSCCFFTVQFALCLELGY
jgi:hypothetical protein